MNSPQNSGNISKAVDELPELENCPSCGGSLDEVLLPYKVIKDDLLTLRAMQDELEATRAQLLHLEKLNSIGQLSAGVAHEFNNIIAGMKGFAQLALESMEKAHIEHALNVVIDLSDRAKSITEGLLSFARKKSPQKTKADINALIDNQLSICKNQLMVNELHYEFIKGDIPQTYVDTTQIEQVLINLITNAAHAMEEEGGTLTMITALEKGQIIIKIQDTGHGMPPEVMRKIFDPFYTTKGALGGGASNEGTGLGLSVSQGIIVSHGGSIDVTSVVGKGTTFIINLPVIDRREDAESESTQSTVMDPTYEEPVNVTPRRVLIVDDEGPIVEALSMYLSAKGHDVFTASNAKDGIEIYRKEKPDVVFLDIVMPGMNGADAFIEMRRLNKNIRAAVITGHTGKHLENLLNTMRQIGTISVFRKPFDISHISQFVNESN